MNFLNAIIFLIIIIFLFFFSLFLIKGNNIYELLIYSNFNFIYDKMEKDFNNILDKENKIKNLVFAIHNNYIYKTTNTTLNYISLLHQFKAGNNILDIKNDEAKIIPLISNLSPKFDFIAYEIK